MDAIFNIGNRLYVGANSADLQEICIKDAESHADMVYLTKIAIFNGGSSHVENRFSAFRHYVILVIVIQLVSIGILVSINLCKQQILYRITAHSLSTFVQANALKGQKLNFCLEIISVKHTWASLVNYSWRLTDLNVLAHTFHAYNL